MASYPPPSGQPGGMPPPRPAGAPPSQPGTPMAPMRPMQKPRTGKCTAGGALLLIGGIMGLLGGLSLLALPAICGGVAFMPFDLVAMGIAIGLICTVIPAITLIGGIMALKRKMWGLCILGGIPRPSSSWFLF